MQNPSLCSDVLPQHIAIIMDGNGRWAKAQGKPRVFGHKNGVAAVRKTISTSAKLGIKAVTLFAFSSENWRRPQEEVGVLMELFISVLSTEVKKLHKNNLRLRVIGDKTRFSSRLQAKIAQAEALTASNAPSPLSLGLCRRGGTAGDRSDRPAHHQHARALPGGGRGGARACLLP